MVFRTLPAIALAWAVVPAAAHLSMAPGIPTAALPGRVVLAGNVHPAVLSATPLGRTDPRLPMERMILAFRLKPEARARLDRLLADLQNPASPTYHQWLSPEQFAGSFGPAPAERARVRDWLTGQGFTIDQEARGGLTLTFSGTVELVEQAFLTPILDYRLQGRTFHANAADPSIPAALADLVEGVVSLHNLPRRIPDTGSRPAPTDVFAGHTLAPDDFATIYDLTPLYAQGLDGSGATLGIVGRTNPGSAAWDGFRTAMGLPANPAAIVVNGPDPGDLGGAEDLEADLDVEWAGAVARNASIQFVTSRSTSSSDGSDLSAQYLVDQNAVAVLSMSFTECERDLGAAGNAFFNDLWSQAASQGITCVVATGDSGPAACDPDTSATGTVQAVNGMASTPCDVAVGGTGFLDGPGSWSVAANGLESALGYIPETAWNQSSSTSIVAGGGGASAQYPKPAWQAAPGVPADGWRDLPDVALAASTQDGYLVQTATGTGIMGGTSAAAPAFAGLMTLVVQHEGGRQGNVNPTLYRLGTGQYNGGLRVFHDISTGDTSVPGVAGFAAAPGYDLATGLGSVDAKALVDHWAAVTGLDVLNLVAWFGQTAPGVDLDNDGVVEAQDLTLMLQQLGW
jgi:subtilase family serine protease